MAKTASVSKGAETSPVDRATGRMRVAVAASVDGSPSGWVRLRSCNQCSADMEGQQGSAQGPGWWSFSRLVILLPPCEASEFAGAEGLELSTGSAVLPPQVTQVTSSYT